MVSTWSLYFLGVGNWKSLVIRPPPHPTAVSNYPGGGTWLLGLCARDPVGMTKAWSLVVACVAMTTEVEEALLLGCQDDSTVRLYVSLSYP